MLRHVKGITDERVLRCFESASKEDDVSALFALRRTPSEVPPGVGAGVRADGSGEAEDMFETLLNILNPPEFWQGPWWGAKAQLCTVVEVQCAQGHQRDRGKTGAKLDTWPAVNGGGFLLVPALIYVIRVPTRMAIGTSAFQIIFVTANVTFLQATQNQTVDVMLAFILLVVRKFG